MEGGHGGGIGGKRRRDRAMICDAGLGLLCVVRAGSHGLSVIQEWATAASAVVAANFGCMGRGGAAGCND